MSLSRQRSSTHNASMRGILLLVFALASSIQAAIVQTYCSNQNTGTDLRESSIYQSNGRCSGNCSGYAFAVVQDNNCWCSNYVPYNQQSVGSCSDTCPGYPYESCGNSKASLYGYVVLQKAPLGTIGAPAATTSVAPTPTPTPTITTEQTTVSPIVVTTVVSDPNPIPFTPSSSDSQPSSTSVASTQVTNLPDTPSVAQAVTPVVTTIINSVGSVVTVTTTPTISANSEQLEQKSSGSGVSGGVVAAIVIAVFVALAAIIAALVLMLHRRRKANRQLMLENESLGGPQRMNSQMSKNGLLNGNNAPTIVFGASHSTHPPESSGSNQLERRLSRPLFYDQRLNPNAIMIQENPSRNSVNTLDDHRDYGRRLNVTNPDPDAD